MPSPLFSPLVMTTLVGGAVGATILLFRQSALESRVGVLEEEVLRLKRAQRRAKTAASGDEEVEGKVAALTPATDLVPESVEPAVADSEGLELITVAEPPVDQVIAQPAVPPIPRPAKRKKASSSLDFETWFGRRFMAGAGALVFLIGIAFFLKYAYDAGWIGPGGRLVIGGLFGGACLYFGREGARKKIEAWADLLTSLGFSIWYVCTYFALEIYELWTQPASFAVGVAITIAALVVATRRQSWLLMTFALLGGYLCPLMLEQYHASAFISLGWLVLLAGAGVVASAWQRWQIPAPVALVGSSISYWFYLLIRGMDSEQDAILYFHLVGLVIFGLVPYLPTVRRRLMPLPSLEVVATIGTAVILFSLREVYPARPQFLGLLFAGAALLFAAPVFLLRRASADQNDWRDALLVRGFVILISGFGLFVGLPFGPILLGATTLAASRRSRNRSAGVALAGVAVVAAGLTLFTMVSSMSVTYQSLEPFANLRFLGGLLVTSLLALSCFEASRERTGERAPDREWQGFIALVTVVLLGLICQLELAFWWAAQHDFRPGPNRYEAVCMQLLVWGFISIATLVLGLKARIQSLRYVALVPLGAVVVLLLANFDELLVVSSHESLFLFNLRCLTALFLALVLAVHGYLGQPSGTNQNPTVSHHPFLVLAPILAAAVLHLDLGNFWSSRDGERIDSMRTWLILWPFMVLGISVARRFYAHYIAELSVRGIQWLALALLLLAAAAQWGADRLPLVNLDMFLRLGLIGALALSSRLCPFKATARFTPSLDIMAQIVLAVAIAVDIGTWSAHSKANLIFVGQVNQNLGTGLISAAWSLHALALTAAGFYWRRRELRSVGLIFFGIVLAKVVLIDTGSLPRVHRIISFIASGILMLLGSYLYQRVAKLTAIADENKDGEAATEADQTEGSD